MKRFAISIKKQCLPWGNIIREESGINPASISEFSAGIKPSSEPVATRVGGAKPGKREAEEKPRKASICRLKANSGCWSLKGHLYKGLDVRRFFSQIAIREVNPQVAP